MFPMTTGNSPSYAEIALMKLREKNKIDLYPNDDDEPQILKTFREHYNLLEGMNTAISENSSRLDFNQILFEKILTESIYTMIVEPVLEENYPTSRDRMLAYNLVRDFIQEQGTGDLIRQFKYKNVYLAEVALIAEEIFNEMEKHDQLTKEDIDNIENDTIKNKILKKEAKIPKNVTEMISKRVEDSVNEFLDDKKDMDARLRQIYDKAQEKIDKYNQEQDATMMGKQSAVETPDGSDPELGVNAMYNSKMDAQQAEEIQNNGPNTGLGVQEQYLAEAKDMEYQLLNRPYSIFDAMMRIIMESTYKNKILRENYTIDKDKFDYQKLLNDVRTMYTFLECVNTLNIIEIDSDYLKNMLINMQENSDISATVDMKDVGKELSNGKSDLNMNPKDFGEKSNKIEPVKFNGK